MTIVWIRHGLKQYDNNKGPPGCYQHDPDLISGQEEAAARVSEILTEKYGRPNLVLTSPYQRTRQTMHLLCGDRAFMVDATIGEYLGHQKGTPLVHPETLMDNLPVCGESMEDFVERAKKHLQIMCATRQMLGSTIWVITHGLFMQKISRLLKQGGIERTFPATTDFDEMDAIAFAENKLHYYPANLKDDVALAAILDRYRCGGAYRSMPSRVVVSKESSSEETCPDSGPT